MRFSILYVVVFASVGQILIAQEKLNQVQSPTFPASEIIGMQPAAILSPKSYEALETALYSNFYGEETSIIPSDFALEFMPYWATDHGISINEYLYPTNVWDQLVRNSSISVALTQNFFLGDSTKSNGLGIGYRTTFYFSNNADRMEINDALSEIRRDLDISASIGAQLLPNLSEISFLNFWEASKSIIKAKITSKTSLSIEQINVIMEDIYVDSSKLSYIAEDMEFYQEFLNIVESQISNENLYIEFEDYIKNRYGLSLDIAYANLINFPRNEFNRSYVPKQAIWISPNYRFKNELDFLNISGVLRYQWYNTDYYSKFFPLEEVFENNFDYGLSVGGIFKKFSIDFEMVGRSSQKEIMAGNDNQGNHLYRKESDSDFQYIGSFNYYLTKQVVLSYSLGSRFEDITIGETLISMLSLNFGFGPLTKDKLTKEDIY
ncbi:hypothetical protein JM658_12030 [Joostella atrarenae]|uniref:Uncharacterized protein n=1 Tax=Joostella atrarenae TaxID=679257 RepID=A0ABS9J561_9FLAO|nr:hypothetical protein [Joostella atrarenae]MCF8715554.1 hypothetical protein [Joostella atrarenae]